jgi:NAD(P) transhydrogenase subunit alpha
MSPTMIAIYVFVLSCFVGYHVIWGVTPALHTPLMAVTNAISAIVVVGAILVAGSGAAGDSPWISGIGFFAVFLASINIFGGFVVTNRMLAMFKKKK